MNSQFGSGWGEARLTGPGNILSLDEEFDSADEVRFMDP